MSDARLHAGGPRWVATSSSHPKPLPCLGRGASHGSDNGSRSLRPGTCPRWKKTRRLLHRTGIDDFEEDVVRGVEHGGVVELFRAAGVFRAVARGFIEELDLFPAKELDRGVDVGFGIDRDPEVVHASAVVVVDMPVGSADEPEAGFAVVAEAGEGFVAEDLVPAEKSEEIFVEAEVFRVDVELQMADMRFHRLSPPLL